jgi:hypothetical protein
MKPQHIFQTVFGTQCSLVTLLAITLGLSGCGGTGQDAGNTKATGKSNISGVAVDGHLMRATAFIDTNNNATRDPWEPFAFTDNDGYFSYNPLTKVDYCAANATSEQAQYCLSVTGSYTSVVVRMDGGYDALTGEPFVGQLSRRINIEADKKSEPITVSPITTLLTDVTTKSDQDAILKSLDVTAADLDTDYLDTTKPVNSKLLNTALKIHKVVTVLSDRLTDHYTEIGESTGTPNDATAIVYKNLSKEIVNAPINSATESNEVLTRVLNKSEAALRENYSENEIQLPTQMKDSDFSRIITITKNISPVIDQLMPKDRTGVDASDVKGEARLVESIVIKTINEKQVDTSIDNAAHFITDTNNAIQVSDLTDSLNTENVNMSALVKNTFVKENFSTPEKISTVVDVPNNVTPFTQIGGVRIKVSNPDLGYAPSALKDDEVEIYFSGAVTALEGSFVACGKHIVDASTNGTLGDGSTRGEIIKGYWSLLGSSGTNVKSFNLLLTLNFLGANYQAIMKPAGEQIVNGNSVQLIRFDNSGEFIEWQSQGVQPMQEALPNTSADCERRLPSRIGL